MRRKPLFPPPVNPATGKLCKNHGRQNYTPVTILGDITLRRRWWSSESTGSFAPVDDLIDAHHESVTIGVREMVARMNNGQRSFEAVASVLQRTAQITLGAEQIRLLVEAEGRRVLKQHEAGTLEPAFQATDCKIPTDALPVPDAPPRSLAVALGQQPITRIYVGTDGVMVPVIADSEKVLRRKKVLSKRQKSGKKRRPLRSRKKGWTGPYREFKVVEFHDETGQYTHQILTADSRKRVGIHIRREALKLDAAKADERVANVDGASWIPTQLEVGISGLILDGLGLDYWHFAENIHRCRRSVFGRESAEGKTWAEELGECFRDQGFEPGWEKLLAWRATLKSPGKRKAADRLINYTLERRAMISYPEFRKWGWQIGSGPTEARCKTTTYRLKAPGCRWDVRNAEAVAALTTLWDSGQWNNYWNLHTQLAI